MSEKDIREGEIAVELAEGDYDAAMRLAPIGSIRSPWPDRRSCPRNLRLAREQNRTATVEIADKFRPGLDGLHPGDHVILLYWMHEARRDLVVQSPRHAEGPRGVFSLRSPVRPNPIALAVVRLIAIDPATGILTIDAIDCIDGTPLVDLKSYIPRIDAVCGGDYVRDED